MQGARGGRPPLRDWLGIPALFPALKRWAKLASPLRGWSSAVISPQCSNPPFPKPGKDGAPGWAKLARPFGASKCCSPILHIPYNICLAQTSTQSRWPRR
jgi:hypothetical protein